MSIVVCGAADTSGKNPSNCRLVEVTPDGHWATQTESRDEQLFSRKPRPHRKNNMIGMEFL